MRQNIEIPHIPTSIIKVNVGSFFTFSRENYSNIIMKLYTHIFEEESNLDYFLLKT